VCGQVVEFDVNKEVDSTGDLLVHVVVKQGERNRHSHHNDVIIIIIAFAFIAVNPYNDSRISRPRNVWLSNVQEDANAMPLSSCGDMRSPRAEPRGPLRLRDDDDNVDISCSIML